MGANNYEDFEQPLHVVAVASFLMDITEVTVGILDMGGNVSEWTSSFRLDDAGAYAADHPISRGGSCDTHNPSWIRTTARMTDPKVAMLAGLGVRCVRSEP